MYPFFVVAIKIMAMLGVSKILFQAFSLMQTEPNYPLLTNETYFPDSRRRCKGDVVGGVVAACRVRVATVCEGALQSELLASGSERESLQQELASLRLAVERAERSARQETARLTAEVASLRQRLDRADTDLLHARKENLRLTEQMSSLDKEVQYLQIVFLGGNGIENSPYVQLNMDCRLLK